MKAENNRTNIKKEGYLQEYHHYFHLRDTAGQERDFHFHEFDKIVILLSGKVSYAVENEVYALHPLDVLLIRHHMIHKALIDKSVPYERIIIYLDEKRYSSLFPEAGLTECFRSADESGQRLISMRETQGKELLALFQHYEAVSLSSEVKTLTMRELCIVRLLLLLGEERRDVRPSGTVRRVGRIEETLSYINENPGADLSVDRLASRMFLSKAQFMRLFRESTGTTVHSYVLQKRLLNASRLIREGTDASEAASLSGFEDYSSFYRAFRKEFGIPPGALKNSRKTEA